MVTTKENPINAIHQKIMIKGLKYSIEKSIQRQQKGTVYKTARKQFSKWQQ